jgi:hypothetical protein
MAQNWAVGMLYGGGYVNGLKVWTQPTPGGLVYPQPQQYSPENFQGYQQSIMSYPALYEFACGHFLNCPAVYEVYQPSLGEQVALVCCNQCGFIQQIIAPYSNFQSYIDTPILVA